MGMYIPDPFKETNPARIAALIEAYPFAMLVTAGGGTPFVNWLPLMFDAAIGEKGGLLGHMARANPQWRQLAEGMDTQVIFQGPHAYVSPSWYSSPGVPTWNYALVHLRGTPRLIEDDAETETLLARQTRVFESRQPNPWQPDLAGERRARLLGMIVGFEIEITEIRAKFKLSQNRPEEDRSSVIERLSRSGDQTEAAVARLMGDPMAR